MPFPEANNNGWPDAQEEVVQKMLFGKFTDSDEEYTTGTDQRLVFVHPETPECLTYGCVIHAPTQHAMRDCPTHWRTDRQIMERICKHGIGHPDPDHIGYVRRTWGEERAQMDSIHGCDGCCVHG